MSKEFGQGVEVRSDGPALNLLDQGVCEPPEDTS
jgi:hypothetical protein